MCIESFRFAESTVLHPIDPLRVPSSRDYVSPSGLTSSRRISGLPVFLRRPSPAIPSVGRGSLL